jgi:hypothetical protein
MMNTGPSEKSVSADMLQHNDLGIWVCTGSASVIGPYLFIQSLCADREPSRREIEWGGKGRPPGLPGESGRITLIGGKASRELSGQGNLYLFCATVPITAYLERGGRLQDWQFPARMAGIVVLFDRQQDHLGAYRLLKALRLAGLAGNRTLAWAGSQGLPLVVAASGYPRPQFDAGRFRERYGLPAGVPVLPGPSLADKPQRGPDGERRNTGGILGNFRFILGSNKVTFDPDYARRLVQAINAH